MRIDKQIDKKYLLFDLDGTITDSKIGILKSYQYAAKHFGIDIKDEDLDLYIHLIGPPLRDSIRLAGITDEKDIDLAVTKYREYLLPKGIYENQLYPGIEDLLINLKNRGKTLILATSKHEAVTRKIMDHFQLTQYFDFIAGAIEGRTDKADVILYALDHFNILSDEAKVKAVMIGDRYHDIIGASKAGIESVGVLYGYGSEEELTSGEYKASYIVKNIDELSKLIK